MEIQQSEKDKYKGFQGVWPALFTPTRKDGKVNEKELEKLIELLINQGMDGIYLLGSTGQGFLYSEEERKSVAKICLEIVDQRLPVMVQVGALNTDESVRLARYAAQHGANAISSVGPIYYGASVNMAFEHYKKIAQATDLPFFPYQIGKSATNALIDKLSQIENIGGMKLTTQNLTEISNIHNLVGSSWKLFSGADELLCHAALCGTSGAIGTSYNLIGDSCKTIRQEFLNGKVSMAAEFMLALQALIEEVLPSIWWFFRRAMLLKHNIDIGDPRPPLLPGPALLTDEEIIARITRLENLAHVSITYTR
ncbi:MAG: dihydrodipicolinate synthase family protein [Chitinophagaceae bacterium]|nr:dihydrodipicolinate synthase family protein [Chitinophagaceae bacterium]